MFNRGMFEKDFDKIWRSFLSIISAFAIVLSLVLLLGLLSIVVRIFDSHNFKYLYEQMMLATLLIPGLMASGNYLSKKSKPPRLAATSTSVPLLRKEIDLAPYIIYLFSFLLGISASSYFLYKHISSTNSAVFDQVQLSELKKSTRHPAISYYFGANEYDSITNVIIASGEGGQDVGHDPNAQIERLINGADERPEVIEIYGYADESGRDAENIILSRKRAEYVDNLIRSADLKMQVKTTVVSGGVIVSSCNETDANDRERCLADNRRVDVYLSGYLPAKMKHGQ